jgi:transposase
LKNSDSRSFPERSGRLVRGDCGTCKAIESQTDRIGQLTEAVAVCDSRTAELDKLLDDSHRSGKRQAAPFSKGEQADEPKIPGRRSGKDHGRHGHRRMPVAPIDRELQAPFPSCCPD